MGLAFRKELFGCSFCFCFLKKIWLTVGYSWRSLASNAENSPLFFATFLVTRLSSKLSKQQLDQSCCILFIRFFVCLCTWDRRNRRCLWMYSKCGECVLRTHFEFIPFSYQYFQNVFILRACYHVQNTCCIKVGTSLSVMYFASIDLSFTRIYTG